MKFTLSWLKEFLDTDASLDEIVERLTMIGLEVESVDKPAEKYAPFKVVEVLSAVQHPNADRLRVCMVNTGEGAPLQIVCGAPNARAGMKAVLGLPGTHIPGKDITLKVGKIRDVESHGMLISGAEIEFNDDHDGIIEMPADAPVGKPFAEVLGLDDPVIEINLTPNRSDCTGVMGIARDLAAADLGALHEKTPKPVKGEFPCPVSVTLDFGQTPPLCPAFALRLVKGVKNGPSPDWLQARLRAIGLRPINALVDITNFITFDRGRPLHVFDAAKVKGNLVVRRASNGEQFLALDGKTYTLDNAMCVIADEAGVESLAGIMGGEASGCDESTTDVLIESALWEPLNIAQTGRKLGINSDARYRFERGVDPNFMLPGLELATQMVLDLCGGTPSEVIVAGKAEAPERIIDVPVGEVKRLTGLEVALPEFKRILGHLGFFVAGAAPVVKVAPPSWRPDVEGKADIVEEIMRIVGVDRVPETPFPRGVGGAQARADHSAEPHPQGPARARRPWHDRGRHLVVHRASARPNCSTAASQNWRWPIRSLPNCRTCGRASFRVSSPPPSATPTADFRIRRCSRSARCSAATSPTTSSWPRPASAARSPSRRAPAGIGRTARSRWMPSTPRPMPSPCSPPPARQWRRSRWCRAVRPGSIPAARARSRSAPRPSSAISASCIRARSKRSTRRVRLVAFELILDRIPEGRAKATRAKPALDLSPFQPVTRDFAFVVDRTVNAGDIVRTAQGADKQLITGVTVFDVYEGAGLEPGKKSVAIAVTIQPREKTMTDQEIDALGAKIVAEVGKRTGGTLRG